MKSLRTSTLTVFCVMVVFSALLSAQDDPDPNSSAPVLIGGSDPTRVLAVRSGDFNGEMPFSGPTAFRNGSELTIFLANGAQAALESERAFRVFLTQADKRVFELTPLSIQFVKGGNLALSLRLADRNALRGQPYMVGDGLLNVTWRGLSSNFLKIGVGRSGGNIDIPPSNNVKPMPISPGRAGYRWAGDRIRFLEQAAFGPSTAEDDRLRRIGIRTWLAEQFDAPYPTIPMPVIQQMPTTVQPDCQAATFPACYRDRYTLTPLQTWFFREAAYGNAQLRHRVAWALGEVLVTSGVVTQQSSHAIAYHKILLDNAFGNYRQLLNDVTLSPTMGNYLDMVRSTKANPNENYPREILQLFSIGLYMLNQDGTLKLDAQNNPIPTYDQGTINEFSKVFTGWTFNNFGPNATPGAVNYRDPMILTPANHDLSAKSLMNYPGASVTSIAACASCTTNAEISAYADESLNRALDNIFNHPNVGPYIGKLLIQHMVMSDPSPAYVSRVAAAFNNNGGGIRGDMRAVIRAVLLDPEARGDIKTAPRYGKLREPVQIITNLMRLFPAKAFNGIDPSDGALSSGATLMGQNPFNSPTVFNYFPPDHIIPGTTILSPEFDLLNTGLAVNRTNFLYTLIFDGITPNATDSLRGTSLDFSEYVPYSTMDSTGTQLVSILNSKMMHGAMTQQHRDLLLPAIQAVPESDPIKRIKTAVYLIAVSSQYQVQK